MKKSSKIAAAGRWSIYVGVAGLVLSGLALAWQPTEAGPAWVPALQGLCRQLHGALAMLALLGIGALTGHISAGWERRKNLTAGFFLLGFLGLLAASAWLLYYAAPGAWHDSAARVHTWVGYFLAPMLVVHIRLGRSSR